MKRVTLGILVTLLAAGAGCSTGSWEHGTSWEAMTSEAPRSSPYMPTVYDEAKLRQATLRDWHEVHVPKMGIVGYLMTEVSDIYKLEGPDKMYYVFDADHERIGFFTQRGATYRYVFEKKAIPVKKFTGRDESVEAAARLGRTRIQGEKLIGHYQPEEAVAHLLKVPVQVVLKPVPVRKKK